MKRYLHKLHKKAHTMNTDNIMSLVEINHDAKILDLGCDKGDITLQLGKKAKSTKLYGLDINKESLKEAALKGINTQAGDLNNKLPYQDETFDIVHSNQVFEHLCDLDTFIGEIRRILRPGGYTIISTENLASWVNIGSLILGWQPFSLALASSEALGVGNPFSIHRNEKIENLNWLHKRVFAYKGLVEMFEIHKFDVEKVKGAGYFPLPAFLGRIDKFHSHFITVKCRKPKN